MWGQKRGWRQVESDHTETGGRLPDGRGDMEEALVCHPDRWRDLVQVELWR